MSLLCVKEARSIIFQIIVISCKQNVYHFFPVDAKAMLKTKGVGGAGGGVRSWLTGRLVCRAPTGVVEM